MDWISTNLINSTNLFDAINLINANERFK
jgi:hypothetical protein